MARGIEIDKVIDDEGTRVEIIGTKVEIEEIRTPAHETARSMLWDDPWSYVIALATMYKRRTIVPPKKIPALIKAFEWAKGKFIEHVDEAIAVLKEQQKEAKEKEKKTEA